MNYLQNYTLEKSDNPESCQEFKNLELNDIASEASSPSSDESEITVDDSDFNDLNEILIQQLKSNIKSTEETDKYEQNIEKLNRQQAYFNNLQQKRFHQMLKTKHSDNVEKQIFM